MNLKHKISLEITFTISLFFIIFGSIFIFFFSDSISIKDFFNKLFEQKIIFGKNVNYFYFYVFLKSFFIIFGIYFITFFFTSRHFIEIEKYNNKLKDYNHYLAHELKTPISVLNSNLDILKYGFDKNKIQDSQNELKKMVEIIDGLLNFSETIQLINKKDINLENFIRACIAFLDQNNSVVIYNKEFNFSLNTDEILFERVVKNLIENGLKYSIDKKVKIIIKSNKIIFENNLFTTIDENEIDNLFNKFYSKSYNENKGYGLGLSMIKEIVNTLGYTLNIYSENNKFRVVISFINNK